MDEIILKTKKIVELREIAKILGLAGYEKMKKAEYTLGCIGKTFEGIISGVTSYGIYITLPNTVEGMARAGGWRGKYSLGDRVKVMVKSVDVAERTIDFTICR